MASMEVEKTNTDNNYTMCVGDPIGYPLYPKNDESVNKRDTEIKLGRSVINSVCWHEDQAMKCLYDVNEDGNPDVYFYKGNSVASLVALNEDGQQAKDDKDVDVPPQVSYVERYDAYFPQPDDIRYFETQLAFGYNKFQKFKERVTTADYGGAKILHNDGDFYRYKDMDVRILQIGYHFWSECWEKNINGEMMKDPFYIESVDILANGTRIDVDYYPLFESIQPVLHKMFRALTDKDNKVCPYRPGGSAGVKVGGFAD